MTDLAQRAEPGLGVRIGRLFGRILLTLIIASPIAVGFWLAPKAGDAPPPPEFAPPPSSALPDALIRGLPTVGQDQPANARPINLTSSGG
jgi:hypothetical protein